MDNVDVEFKCLFWNTVKYCPVASKDSDYKKLVAENLTWPYYKFLVTDWWPALILKVVFLVVEYKRGQRSFSKGGETIYDETMFLSLFLYISHFEKIILRIFQRNFREEAFNS